MTIVSMPAEFHGVVVGHHGVVVEYHGVVAEHQHGPAVDAVRIEPLAERLRGELARAGAGEIERSVLAVHIAAVGDPLGAGGLSLLAYRVECAGLDGEGDDGASGTSCGEPAGSCLPGPEAVLCEQQGEEGLARPGPAGHAGGMRHASLRYGAGERR
ncbi:MAG: hypothetical protein ACNYNX_05530 [Leucobacter sp.]